MNHTALNFMWATVFGHRCLFALKLTPIFQKLAKCFVFLSDSLFFFFVHFAVRSENIRFRYVNVLGSLDLCFVRRFLSVLLFSWSRQIHEWISHCTLEYHANAIQCFSWCVVESPSMYFILNLFTSQITKIYKKFCCAQYSANESYFNWFLTRTKCERTKRNKWREKIVKNFNSKTRQMGIWTYRPKTGLLNWSESNELEFFFVATLPLSCDGCLLAWCWFSLERTLFTVNDRCVHIHSNRLAAERCVSVLEEKMAYESSHVFVWAVDWTRSEQHSFLFTRAHNTKVIWSPVSSFVSVVNFVRILTFRYFVVVLYGMVVLRQ